MSVKQRTFHHNVPLFLCQILHTPLKPFVWLLSILLMLSIAAPSVQGFLDDDDDVWQEKPPALSAEETAAMLDSGINELTRQLVAYQTEPDIRFSAVEDGLAITSFVELKKLTRTSSFGRYLAEQIMTDFQQRGFPVTEIRKTNDILIQEQRGEYGLSRDPESIRKKIDSGALLTGTYTLTDHFVFVNARILDVKTGMLLTSGSTRLSRTQLVNTLLADRASAETRQPVEIFVKRLEL